MGSLGAARSPLQPTIARMPHIGRTFPSTATMVPDARKQTLLTYVPRIEFMNPPIWFQDIRHATCAIGMPCAAVAHARLAHPAKRRHGGAPIGVRER